MNSVECPYCENDNSIDIGDIDCSDESTVHQHQCEYCNKYFAFNTVIDFYFNARKANCLNGGNHTKSQYDDWCLMCGAMCE